MSFALLAAVFFAAVNPFGAAVAVARGNWRGEARPGVQALALGAAVAFALFVVAATASGRILGFLEVEPETFRVAAGVVMAAIGLRFAVFGPTPATSESHGLSAALFPLAIPLLAGPAALMAAVSFGADEGAGRTLGAAAIATAVALGLCTSPGVSREGWLDALARLTGALLVALGAGLIVDGVRAI